MRRRYIVAAAALVILAGGAASAYYVVKHRYGDDVLGSSSGFNSTDIAQPTTPTTTKTHPHKGKHKHKKHKKKLPGVLSPMFGVEPERLHVGIGHLRPPFRLAWQSGGSALVEFPPVVAFGAMYYATSDGEVIARSTRTGKRMWTKKLGRCEAATPAVSPLHGGIVFETFLNRLPCHAGLKNPGDGLIVAIQALGHHKILWKRNLGASESSPLIVGNRLYIGTEQGYVYCLHAKTGTTIWRYHVSSNVKDAIAYDAGKVFFGSYNGNLYALGAAGGKLIWTASSAGSLVGGHGTFYSTPAVAYSRVYIGSTDGGVYAFDERTGRLVWVHRTGGYVYASPAVFGSHVLIGSYDHNFYGLNAATGRADWAFRAGGTISGSATVVGGIVYFANLGRYGTRRTYALNPATGHQIWSWHDGGFGPIATDGQKLYMGGWGRFYAFEKRRIYHRQHRHHHRHRKHRHRRHHRRHHR